MLFSSNKILKLIKLAIKLVNKLIFTIQKIEKTYEETQSKVENLSLTKVDLSDLVEKLEKVQKKIEGEK